MNQQNQKHFDDISDRYERAALSWREIYEQVEARINPLLKDKVVLDVGNGGHFAYDLHLPRRVIAMDVAPAMLDKIQEPSVEKVVGDAQDMEVIEDESVDIVIFQLVLHHINGPNVKETIELLEKILAEARRKIRPGGHLVVTEVLLSPWLFRLESGLFRATRFILSRFSVPMIFMFTQPILRERIARVFRIEPREVETVPIRLTTWADPLGGSFPGLIKLPPWMLNDIVLFISPPKT
jgi:ubiquinone/menaquinone biosynthesis C-methylase UbiE